jgi:hypothetical protein
MRKSATLFAQNQQFAPITNSAKQQEIRFFNSHLIKSEQKEASTQLSA